MSYKRTAYEAILSHLDNCVKYSEDVDNEAPFVSFVNEGKERCTEKTLETRIWFHEEFIEASVFDIEDARKMPREKPENKEELLKLIDFINEIITKPESLFSFQIEVTYEGEICLTKLFSYTDFLGENASESLKILTEGLPNAAETFCPYIYDVALGKCNSETAINEIKENLHNK